jgi:uncharacterized damage-inducible protein DinB
MPDDLLEAWRTNHRINLYLIEHITDEGLRCTLSRHGGRDVALQFAHIHNNRVWHLEKRAPDLADDLSVTFLSGVLADEPRRRGFRKGVFTTLAYIVAHESHHRGSILLTLKQCGHQPPKEVRYAIWAWDQM